MVMSHCRGGFGYGLGSGSGDEMNDERIRDFVSSKITHGILDATPVIFGTIKEGIMELLDERFGACRAEITVGLLGAQTLLFWAFKACIALDFFGAKDPISCRRWILDMENAQRMIFCPKGSKTGSNSYSGIYSRGSHVLG